MSAQHTAHTPTPWKVFSGGNKCRPGIDTSEGGFSIVIYGDPEYDGPSVGIKGRTLEEAHANAAFIVRACNCHDELVAALTTLVYETTHLSPEDDDGSHWCRISREALERARTALARAEGRMP